MIDTELLSKKLHFVVNNLSRRGFCLNSELFTELEKKRKRLQILLEDKRADLNRISKKIGKLEGEEKEESLRASGIISNEVKELKNQFSEAWEERERFLQYIPNLIDSDVPEGKSEKEAKILRTIGSQRVFSFPVSDHVDLGEGLKMMANQKAVEMSGTRFSLLSGCLARLHRALANFMLNLHIEEHKYKEFYLPYMVGRRALYCSGQLPKFEEDLFFAGPSGNLGDHALIPTAEVPLVNLIAGSSLSTESLPLKFVSHTPCFRSESCSYGVDIRGLLRLHQFDKVELVQITKPEESELAHEELTQHAEKVLKLLEIPYRVILLAAGDTGFCSAKTYDIEAWFPGQNCYREISSCSNCTDFQARRLKSFCFEKKNGKKERFYPHTLNGSGLAVGRTLVAVMENYQNRDGSITVPEVLRIYMGGLKRIEIDNG